MRSAIGSTGGTVQEKGSR